jgi:hypothetical protein
MNRGTIPVLVPIGIAMMTLACSGTLCGVTYKTTPREEADATGIAVAYAVSTVEAQMQPTIDALRTAAPETASTAVAVATRTAPTMEAVLAAVTPDPLFSPTGAYDPELVLAYYETLVLGTASERSFITDVRFPDFVQAEVDTGLAWTNESYEGSLENGRGFLGLALRPDCGVLSDDINRASFGAFAFQSDEPFPADPDGALRMTREMYPGLDVKFVLQAGESNTFNFESRAMLPLVVQEQPTVVPQLVHAGVTYMTERDQVVVWVVIARGAMVGILDRAP